MYEIKLKLYKLFIFSFQIVKTPKKFLTYFKQGKQIFRILNN